jgi:hypothetical protein
MTNFVYAKLWRHNCQVHVHYSRAHCAHCWLYLCCRSGSQHPSCCLHQSCLVPLPHLQVCTSPLLVFHPCQKPQFRLWCNWPRSLRSLPTHVCWCYTLRWAAWWAVWLQWVCILHYALLLKELSKSCLFVLHALASYLVRPNTSKLVSSYLSVLLNLNEVGDQSRM